jgi:hypothetical protein
MFEKPDRVLNSEKSERSTVENKELFLTKKQEAEGVILEGAGLGSEEKIQQLTEGIRALTDDLEKIGDESVKKKFSLKAFHALKRLSQGTVGVTALLAVVGATNYGRTRYEISETQTKDGIEYSHEDFETTRNIDTLLGKESITEDLKIKIYQSALAEEYIVFGMDVPADLEMMSEKDLKEKHAELHEAVYGVVDQEEVDTELERSASSVMRFDQKTYETVWEMQKENGSPKIRFVFNEEGERIIDMEAKKQSGRAHYNPSNNTLYINPLQKGDSWLAEIAHAKQFDENPIRAYGLAVESGLNSFSTMLKEGLTFRQAYDKYEYNTPGTLEHEAHSVLEKEIFNKMENAYKNHEDSKKGG